MWKVYFVIITIISGASFLWLGIPRIYEAIDILIRGVSLLGLFGYAWEYGFIGKGFWKIFFFVMIIWNIVYDYFIPLPEKVAESLQRQSPSSAATTGLIFFIPLIVAIFLYAYNRDDLW